jgi:hypothetical protein
VPSSMLHLLSASFHVHMKRVSYYENVILIWVQKYVKGCVHWNETLNADWETRSANTKVNSLLTSLDLGDEVKYVKEAAVVNGRSVDYFMKWYSLEDNPFQYFCILSSKIYKFPGSDQIPAELVQAGGDILHSKIHKLINSIWNKEELPYPWKKSITGPVQEKGNKSDCNNYRGIPLLSTAYKILSNIHLSMLSPSIDEIIGDHQCGFRHNRSTTDQIFCIRQIL